VGLFALLKILLFASLSTALAQLYEQPTLVVDPGMHTAPIRAAAVDAAGRLAVTGSDDKTVRVWSLTDGKLVRTIRMPAGPGYFGRIYAVAMSPGGELIAAGGWMRGTADKPEDLVYLFETRTGKLTKQISTSSNTLSLAFSQDGRYLAAGLRVGDGLRIYDRDRLWSETFSDTDYGDAIYGGAAGGLRSTSVGTTPSATWNGSPG
jgi:WD40 repeat protein